MIVICPHCEQPIDLNKEEEEKYKEIECPKCLSTIDITTNKGREG